MTNSAAQTYCVRCDTNLITLALQKKSNVPARLETARTTALVVGITALTVRVGLNLLAREILPRVQSGAAAMKRPSRTQQTLTGEPPDYIVRGWRSWLIHRSGEHTSGSEKFEWRIKRNR
jgi:hypothetical protein